MILQNLILENSTPLIIVSVAIVLDMISGVIKATINHNLKSSEFRIGLMKKVLDYVLIIVAICLDVLLEVDYISKSVLYSLIAMEFYSVIENIRDFIELPSVIERVLETLSKKED